MNKLLKSLLVGMPLVFLASCSQDEPAGGNDIAQNSETRYLRVNLVNADNGGSRAIGDGAGDYTDGTTEENKIRTIDFYLYDAEKQYHSHVSLGMTAAEDPSTPGNITSVHGFKECTVPVNIVQGEKLPQYVVCIVNAVQPQQYENKSLEESQNALLKSFYSPEDGGGKYFAMNNSVYYGKDVVTGLDNQLIMATPFDTNMLFTETQLKNLTGAELEAATVDIYVERYAAKVNLTVADDAVKPYESANGVVLTFEPKNWGVNAYEKEFYLLKSYRAAGQSSGLDFEDYASVNSVLFDGWNRPDHFRSFWARTPGYYRDSYPLVADDIKDVQGDYPYSVYYQSAKTVNNVIGTPQYMVETTLKGTRLTGEGMPDQYLPLTSIPSVLLVGQYKINGEAKTFYCYQTGAVDADGDDTTTETETRPLIFAANDGDIDGVPTLHDRMVGIQSVVLVKGADNSYTPVRAADIAAGSPFVIKHPDADAREGLKINGDIVTLQIDAAATGFYYYDAVDHHDYCEINTPEAIARVNRLLYQNLGGAHTYTDGMAYFSAPIQHWGWYRADNENLNKGIDEWDWSKMQTGDFGVVRNHVYSININTIKGLGTGILDEDDPIVPPSDKVSYQVRFRVNIQKWATLPTQNWEW